MTADAHTIALDGLRAIAARGGTTWAVLCNEEDCKVSIVGYASRDVAVGAANHHLLWHLNGRPTCRDCGAWLRYRTSKRCRKGTCEVNR